MNEQNRKAVLAILDSPVVVTDVHVERVKACFEGIDDIAGELYACWIHNEQLRKLCEPPKPKRASRFASKRVKACDHCWGDNCPVDGEHHECGLELGHPDAHLCLCNGKLMTHEVLP